MSATRPPSRQSRRAVLAGLAAGAGLGLVPPLRALAADDGPEPPSTPESLEINARPIPHFDRSRPEVKRFGALEFRGGLVLNSPSPNFGGWSGLLMESDGRGLLSISDVGTWLSADIAYEGTRPIGLKGARLGPLRDSRGRPLRSKREQDAEGLTLLEGDLRRGTLLISFERLHRIVRYPVRERQIGAPVGSLRMPADARRMMENQGLEAIAILRGGRHKGSLVAFAERLTGGSGYHTGWIWVGGEPQRFHLSDIDGFNITDAAVLPDGDLLVLERRYRVTEGVKMRLRRIAAAELVPGARITGSTLVEANSGFEIDNMEGLAVHRSPAGETVVSMISDDNFNRLLQRTLFLQFTLLDEPRRASAIAR